MTIFLLLLLTVMFTGPLPVQSITLGHVTVPNTSLVQLTNFSCLLSIKSAREMTFKHITVNVDYETSHPTKRVGTGEFSGLYLFVIFKIFHFQWLISLVIMCWKVECGTLIHIYNTIIILDNGRSYLFFII